MHKGRRNPSSVAGEDGKGRRDEEAPDRAASFVESPSGTLPTPNASPRGGGEEKWPHLAGRLEAGAHLLPVRVYYEDTDFSGLVYHASYLRFMERGRTDFLRLAGVDQSSLHAEGEGLIFAVRRMTLDFLKPARMDDVLVVETRTRAVRGATILIGQRVLREGEALLTAEVTVACLGGGRPRRIPDALRAALAGGSPDGREEA